MLLFIASPLPTALPPIVRAEIIPVTNSDTKSSLMFVIFIISDTITTPDVPDTIPHTSPTTSQHIDDTLSVFFKSWTPILPPYTFLELIE